MRVEVTWDATDVHMGRKLRDKDGSKHVVCQTASPVHCWLIVRYADHFATGSMTLAMIVEYLNAQKFLPDELS